MSGISRTDAFQKSFPSRKELLDFLMQRSNSWTGRTGVMAGHYMLVYRPETDCLIPLMKSIATQDPQATKLEMQACSGLGDFPEITFEMALSLLAANPKMDGKICLLVNDHQLGIFQRDVPLGEKFAELRRQYYRQGNVPEPFKRMLTLNSGRTDFFLRNDANRKKDSTLPSETFFFSENSLQNRFLDYRQEKLLNLDGFRKTTGHWGAPKLVYDFPETALQHCLVDFKNNDCGCSGVMLEFLLQLQEKGIENLILFIPDDCHVQVDASVRAGLDTGILTFKNIIGVWGGGLDKWGYVPLDKLTDYCPL